MRISNLRIEDRNNGRSYLIADLESGFTKEKNLWFSVDRKYRDWLTDDVYDAFLTAALYPAQFYREEIKIDGAVSPRLYKNVVNYVPGVIADFLQQDKWLAGRISVKGCKRAKQLSDYQIGTGFSGG